MRLAIFDIETRVDKSLLNRSFFAGRGLGDEEACERFAAELRNGFFPLSVHVPISIAIGEADDALVLRRVESLAQADYTEERLVREFWRRIESLDGRLISFNGRQFDLPVLELAALRYGIPAPRYFSDPDSPRQRGPNSRHFDIYEFLTNSGATHLRGGMNLLLRMIGMPGKADIDGSRVQELFDGGHLGRIHEYCRRDVIQTYFLMLRVELMRGRIGRDAYDAARTASAGIAGELELTALGS